MRKGPGQHDTWFRVICIWNLRQNGGSLMVRTFKKRFLRFQLLFPDFYHFHRVIWGMKWAKKLKTKNGQNMSSGPFSHDAARIRSTLPRCTFDFSENRGENIKHTYPWKITKNSAVDFISLWNKRLFFSSLVKNCIQSSQSTTSVPAVKNLKRLDARMELIYNQPMLKNIYKTPPIISYRRAKSLKNILVGAKLWRHISQRRNRKDTWGSQSRSVMIFSLTRLARDRQETRWYVMWLKSDQGSKIIWPNSNRLHTRCFSELWEWSVAGLFRWQRFL